MTKYVYTYLLLEIGEMGEMDEIVEMVEIGRHFAHFARATSLRKTIANLRQYFIESFILYILKFISFNIFLCVNSFC